MVTIFNIQYFEKSKRAKLIDYVTFIITELHTCISQMVGELNNWLY